MNAYFCYVPGTNSEDQSSVIRELSNNIISITDTTNKNISIQFDVNKNNVKNILNNWNLVEDKLKNHSSFIKFSKDSNNEIIDCKYYIGFRLIKNNRKKGLYTFSYDFEWNNENSSYNVARFMNVLFG